jgi:endonuclease YncB( thermonuclease family)
VRLNVDLGCDVHLNLTIRLAGINASEMRTVEGPIAKAWLVNAIGDSHLVLRTVKDRREKFGRYLGYLWRVSEGTFTEWGFATDLPSINARMIEAG